MTPILQIVTPMVPIFKQNYTEWPVFPQAVYWMIPVNYKKKKKKKMRETRQDNILQLKV